MKDHDLGQRQEDEMKVDVVEEEGVEVGDDVVEEKVMGEDVVEAPLKGEKGEGGVVDWATAKPIKGTSLWVDAWRRVKSNRAALAGAIVVAVMIFFAASYELMSRFVTHFTMEEQHPFVVPKPPGARSIPSHYYTLLDPAQGWDFKKVDANDDGYIEPNEIRSAYRRVEMKILDQDGDGKLNLEEYLAAPLAMPAPSQFVPTCEKWKQIQRSLAPIGDPEIFACDAGPDGLMDEKEAGKLLDLVGSGEAQSMVAGQDRDGDGLLNEDEFQGLAAPKTHLIGTDQLGRDLLTRVIYGARISLSVGLLATLVSFLIGVTYGAVAGYFGGKVDNFMMRIVDVMYGLPFMFLVILLMVVFGQKILLLFLALGAIQWLTMARIVRGQVISLKQREFVQAAKTMGASNLSIIFRHIIPNALGPIIVYATLTVPAVMLEEAFLSFLGLGVQAPQTSWGSLISEGRQLMETAPWLIIFPSLALALTLLSLNFLGDGIRDALDPQMRK